MQEVAVYIQQNLTVREESTIKVRSWSLNYPWIIFVAASSKPEYIVSETL